MTRITQFAVVALCVCSLSIHAQQDCAPTLEVETLATHKTVAVLAAIDQIPCRGRTALCPDRCGHGGKVAIFEIIKYVDYHKGGQYGDPKAERLHVSLKGTDPTSAQSRAVIDAVEELQLGQLVVLNWDHLYITNNGSKYPTRPVILLEPIIAPDGTPIITKIVPPTQPTMRPVPTEHAPR